MQMNMKLVENILLDGTLAAVLAFCLVIYAIKHTKLMKLYAFVRIFTSLLSGAPMILLIGATVALSFLKHYSFEGYEQMIITFCIAQTLRISATIAMLCKLLSKISDEKKTLQHKVRPSI